MLSSFGPCYEDRDLNPNLPLRDQAMSDAVGRWRRQHKPWSAHSSLLPMTGVMMLLVRVFEDRDINIQPPLIRVLVWGWADHISMMLVYYI